MKFQAESRAGYAKSMPKAVGEDEDLREGDSDDHLELGSGSGEEGSEVEDWRRQLRQSTY